MPATIDLSGKIFGRLRVLHHAGPYVKCSCSCGATALFRTDRVKSGKTQSCGCYRDDLRAAAKKPSPPAPPAKPCLSREERHLRKVHRGILARCLNPDSPAYPYYGGRGITVCPEWMDADVFVADMLPKYTPGRSIDRVDNDGGYSPSNCTFSTPSQQARNRRCTLRFVNGVSLPGWCRRHALEYRRAYSAFWRVQNALGRTPNQAEVLAELQRLTPLVSSPELV